MKKILFMVALLGFFLSPGVLQAAKIPVEEAVAKANQEIGWEHFKLTGLNAVNKEVWDKYEVLVKGSPSSVPRSEQNYVGGEPRYLGYTPLDELMPNPNYPPDDPASTVINNWNWIQDPWSNTTLGIWWSPTWDNKVDNEPYIKAALNKKFSEDPKIKDPNAKDLFNSTNPAGTNGWYEVTKILQPRTSVTPGLGRMWHRWNNANWYITIIIPNVLPPDIEVTALNNTNPVNVKTKQTAAVNYRNNSSESQTYEAIFYVGGNAISTESITLAVGQDITKNYEWTAPDTAGKVTLKAEARPVPDEKNIANNIKTLTVDVKELLTPKDPDYLPCKEKPSITNTWEELYEWKVWVPETLYDKDGQPYEGGSWEPRSEIVQYTETLQASLSVDTKQGNPNGGRESRGAWEIIPYAQLNRLDPNEVTRSGYGFEVKLQTTYSNAWESKVPAGASPKGGTFPGPDKAVADFYDTKGRFVKRINLVPAKGQAGDKIINWELPSERYTFQDGATIYERKHYVDINIPDGKYLVKVTVSGAGKTDLCLIRKKYVTIYGDMYDDDYTRVSTQDE